MALQILTDVLDPLKQRVQPPITTETVLAGKTIARGSKSRAMVVTGTPGKIVECLTKKYLSLSAVRVFVLDEADFMVQETEAARLLGSETMLVRGELPPSCQIMFFSATYTDAMFDRARTWVPRAVTFKLASNEELMMVKIFKVVLDVRALGAAGKMKALKQIYTKLSMQQSIVFVEQRAAADSVSVLAELS